ncbi:MAG: ATP-binding protein, partial [Bacteroidota bacterium]|nr:ATP-binding protein [Bacteroidota bacterium]
MKQEFASGNPTQLRGKIVADLDCSRQLDRYVREIIGNPNRDQAGVLVAGAKGTGKTFFIENYLRQYERDHPVLIARHY